MSNIHRVIARSNWKREKRQKKGPSKLTLMVSADFLTMWSNTKLIVLIVKSVEIGARSKKNKVGNDNNTIQNPFYFEGLLNTHAVRG